MYKTIFFITIAAVSLSISMLFATPKNQQKHIKEMGDIEGGCSYCHNQATKISREKGFLQGYKKGQINYNKLGTFPNCNSCHTTYGSIIKK
jgi:cytochrome c556